MMEKVRAYYVYALGGVGSCGCIPAALLNWSLISLGNLLASLLILFTPPKRGFHLRGRTLLWFIVLFSILAILSQTAFLITWAIECGSCGEEVPWWAKLIGFMIVETWRSPIVIYLLILQLLVAVTAFIELHESRLGLFRQASIFFGSFSSAIDGIGALQLASTSATEVYINLCIAQLPTLIQRFKHLPTSEVASPPTRNTFAESNLTLLSEVLDQLQQTKKETSYTCLARIAKIKGSWCYESCTKCTHKAYQSSHKYYCPAHGFQDEHSYRCTADAVFFDGVVTTLVGKSCYDTVTSQTDKDTKQLSQEIENLINKPYIFEIQVKKDSQTEAIAINNAYKAPPSTSNPATSSSTALATP